MPKRTDQITDLEKYFWKAENVQKLLGTDYAKQLLEKAGYEGKPDVGSREFVRVAGEFGHMERYYQKQKKDVEEDCGGESAGGRPTYLFQKCLACRIITQLDAETKARLVNHFDKTELGREVLSRDELKLGILDMVTDTELIELLQTQCYFQADRTAGPDNERKGDPGEKVPQDLKICGLHGTDKCSPQTLVDLCSLFRQGRGKGKTAFTYADLSDMCEYFYALYPVVFHEEAYIDRLREQKKRARDGQNDGCEKLPTIFSSKPVLADGIKSGHITPSGMTAEHAEMRGEAYGLFCHAV